MAKLSAREDKETVLFNIHQSVMYVIYTSMLTREAFGIFCCINLTIFVKGAFLLSRLKLKNECKFLDEIKTSHITNMSHTLLKSGTVVHYVD